MTSSSRTLLVLGATSDIARETVRHYAKAGYQLLLAGRDIPALSEMAEELRQTFNVVAVPLAFDAHALEAHAGFYEALTPKPDGVLCAVGHLGSQQQAQADPSACLDILMTNYVGCVSILNCAAEDMARRGSGFIIGIGSVAGDRGRASNYFYGSAKAGLEAYLSGLRNRLAATGVQVLTVKPGFVQTRMTAGLSLPKLLVAQPRQVGREIFAAQQAGQDILYTPWYWAIMMLIIRALPEALFKKLKL